MNGMFLAAFALQWVVIVAMGLLMLGLFRQVGMLHERLGPVGALTLSGGSKVGEVAPSFDLPSLTGGEVRVGGATADGRSTLLFFVSPTCPMCKSMLPVLLSIARENADTTRLVFASDGDEPAQMKMIVQQKLADHPFVLSTDLGRAHGVGKLPYAVLLGADGTVASKGLVNNREHVESLFEAQRTGIASIQEYAARRDAQRVHTGAAK
ncbi:methylamine dehydrogenase accessory protein MauD [Rhizorhabdus wittichii]|uniref:Methylamine utilization protein MauD n=1 Tax=Rhizorhabdus wittichii TaxID=160791 RepID=A0A975CZ14_9SPHN|nr:methylamine dehydrogenase accessory protein MauD [Rhizorhabdus wittichii]ARR53603.1 methylamine dehydrogenase accessory protein MauD [Rhizorhabdus wittichii DC-6]QTH19914.1 methylamine dehydrogenase accessory protein MauD [Rhizorhabdus wittichii]